MSTDLSSLSRFAADGHAPTGVRPNSMWPPDPQALWTPDCKSARVLAVDPSLKGTGWVVVESTSVDPFRILGVGSLPQTLAKGHEGNLLAGTSLRGKFAALIARWDPTHVVHESPPVGGKMARPESALLGGLAFRIAAEDRGMIATMLGAQRAKKIACGNSNAEKKEAHEAAAAYMQRCVAGVAVTNEGQRDAVLVALAAACGAPDPKSVADTVMDDYGAKPTTTELLHTIADQTILRAQAAPGTHSA
jgi:Holliday junction resolvasome RuvABC endonuclease subunit